MITYRLSWEMVNPQFAAEMEARYGDSYSNDLVPPEQWQERRIAKETDDPWDQYNVLKQWADANICGVRNVKLEQALTWAWPKS